jgi:hypothetical protein
MATHGLASTYNTGCRCTPCTDANTERARQVRNDMTERRLRNPAAVPHGLSGYTNWQCRCDICAAAHRDYARGDWDLSRAGQPWTSGDLRLAVRDDLPLYEIARRLKRPYQSVATKRHTLRQAAS